MGRPAARASSRREKHVKWSVTVPPHLAKAAEEQVASGEAPSVSAVVTRALERDLLPAEDELDRLVRHWIETGQVTITEEHREWARRVLDL
jgi:Arc/MetJ-type ribon-helix-helix transcriptional regulator